MINEIGPSLKKLYVARGLKLRDMHAKTGINYDQLSLFFNGKRNFSTRLLNPVLLALDIDLNFIIREKTARTTRQGVTYKNNELPLGLV